MNTDEFKHFKLHANSTLKKLTKDELIDYINIIYRNWKNADETYLESLKNITELLNKITPEKRVKVS